MSNALAIAAVTKSVVHLLGVGLARQTNDGPLFPDPECEVVSLTPSEATKTFASGKSRKVNVFLHRTSPNPQWRNTDPPGHAQPGAAGRPLLALTLHYLITVLDKNGNAIDEAQVLGRVMSVLHDHPILDRATIEAAIAGIAGSTLSAAKSDLARQPEPVRLTPASLTEEEVSRVWSAFQEKYRTSVYYEASPVLIESTLPPRSALPVIKRGEDDIGANVGADLLSAPAIGVLRPRRGLAGVLPGETLTIEGDNVRGKEVRWVVRRPPSSSEFAVLTSTLVEDEVTIRIQDDAQNRLHAGVHTLNARIRRERGGGRAERVIDSAPVPFALLPRIVTGSRLGVVVAGVTTTLTITVSPMVDESQDVAIVIGDATFRPEPFDGPTDSLRFDLTDAIEDLKNSLAHEPGAMGGSKVAAYARLRVDGVESPMIDLDALDRTPPVRRYDGRLLVKLTP